MQSVFGFRAYYTDEGLVYENKTNEEIIPVTDVLNNIYVQEQRHKPYTDKEYQQDWMTFISLCLTAVISYKAYCSENMHTDDFVPNLPHIFMNFEEANNHIGCYPLTTSLPEIWTEFLREAYSHIESRELASETSKIVARTMRLKKLLKLSNFAYFSLHCTLSCMLDRGFESVFSFLQGNTNIKAPTLGIVQMLYSLAFPNQEEGWLLDFTSLENRLLFDTVQEFDMIRSLKLRSRAFSYIVGERYSSRELSYYVTRFSSGSSELKEPQYIDRQLQITHNLFKTMLSRKKPHLCILRGAAGCGKKLTVQYLANEEQTSIVLVDLDKQFLVESHFGDIMDELLFFALVEGDTLCISVKDPSSNIQIPIILEIAKKYQLGIFLLTESMHYKTNPDGYVVNYIDYPSLNLKESVKFWQLFSEGYDFSPSIDWMQTASKYMLTAGQIKSAILGAASTVKFQDKPIDDEMICESVMLQNMGRLSTVADRITVVYTWDDLMLNDKTRTMLKEACNRIKQRHVVEIDWGGKFAYGNGVSILLYGPPGTGKTMSAQVIAGDLGLPLYRINLAHIISKYIGETTKNINAIFDEAKSSNVILFFDEADALFSKRTEVKSSNDRHANTESSYLLQKIEEYPGISILTTNLANVFDEAFRRRINYMINIHMPDANQRLEIWKKCIPPKAPLSDDVDLKLLATGLEFSGSVIRSAVLQAAYYAAGESTSISMVHFARAVRLELWKLGMSEPDFIKFYPR